MKSVEIHTDGACSGNPGPGGWAAVLSFGAHQRDLCGGALATTNNRMELTAALEALSALSEPCRVTLVSDSKYLIDSFEKGWIGDWHARGWTKKGGKPVLNADLWQRLLELIGFRGITPGVHEVGFLWVRGHDGHVLNERCDVLAVAERDRFNALATS